MLNFFTADVTEVVKYLETMRLATIKSVEGGHYGSKRLLPINRD